MNSALLGRPFYENNGIVIDPKRQMLQLPDLTLQLNEMSTPEGKTVMPNKNEIGLFTSQVITIPQSSGNDHLRW